MNNFLDFWSPEDIEPIPTEEIFLMLADLGIPVTEEMFLEEVAACHSAAEIYKRWKSLYVIMAEGRDADFPWMAADVLWRRLAPDKISVEMLDDMMQEGYELIEEGDPQGCHIWLEIWEVLKPRFTPEMRKVDDANSVFEGSEFLSNWCQDLEMELRDAAVHDPTFHDLRIRYCREFCEFFPEETITVPNMKRAVAESLYLSGKTDEADLEFLACVAADPKDPWNYIIWGDMYSGMEGQPSDPSRAEDLYRKALGLDPQEDKGIRERIADLRKRR